MQWPMTDGQIRPDVDHDVIMIAAIDRIDSGRAVAADIRHHVGFVD